MSDKPLLNKKRGYKDFYILNYSDVIKHLKKFNSAKIFLDDGKRIGCVKCKKLSGFYYSVFNEDKQVFELKCPKCWKLECFGELEAEE